MFYIKNLQVSYGESQVIGDLNLELEQGEILAVMGRNGMGKTTLFKSLIGILGCGSGSSIKIDDVELAKQPSYKRVRNGLAYVPQGRMIYPTMTVTDNIRVGLDTAKSKKIPNYIYELFPVLDEMGKRMGGNLSGGQQQQLAIARALVTEPKVLLLDEPTEGIQPSIIKEMARSLKKVRDMQNISIIVAEQVLSFTLDACDRFLVMEGGSIVHSNTRDEVDAEKIKEFLSV
ncbi:urea ABC transporter ATP-binding subunit UrtE [Opitutales bacterium]|nr:urea ABC transporter ATP-binding subunit UrtE [Opitutales bacterium]MDB2506754.1 urea ABC transporter ATP-binding subunit UrtE [Opitutales bacterium]MDB2681546.1 urea ABC transporter ATP-binding subunit UrtE [Opitutales bacterium]